MQPCMGLFFLAPPHPAERVFPGWVSILGDPMIRIADWEMPCLQFGSGGTDARTRDGDGRWEKGKDVGWSGVGRLERLGY
jgi:hypothetical protein